MSRPKQIILMRTDLMMTKGKMIAQGAHASMRVLLDHFKMNPLKVEHPEPIPHWPAFTEWLTGAFAKICLRVDSEEELLEHVKKATEAKLPVAIIVDSGRTMFHGVPTITCAAIGPAYPEGLDPITGDLKLL